MMNPSRQEKAEARAKEGRSRTGFGCFVLLPLAAFASAAALRIVSRRSWPRGGGSRLLRSVGPLADQVGVPQIS